MSEKTNGTPDALRQLLAGAQRGQTASRRRWWLAGGGAALLLLVGWLALGSKGEAPGQYLTEPAARGKLVVTASASGTLQPTKSVDVGSELSGTLAEVLVQENDVVRKGQLLARLDPAKLDDAVIKSRAAVAAAEASVAEARATLAENRAALARMRRVAELSGGKVPAPSELDTADAAVQRAVASEASALAQVAQARADRKSVV